MVRPPERSAMKMTFWRTSAVALVLSCLAAAVSASGRPDGRDARSANAARSANGSRAVSVTAGHGLTVTTRVTRIVGSAWTADNAPIPQAHIRLRNAISGHVEASAVASDLGEFEFLDVDGGSYLVELVNDAGRIQVVGQVFTIAPGETVATFVRLNAKVPWFTGFFGNTLSAVSSTAASEGITALAPVARPVSANK